MDDEDFMEDKLLDLIERASLRGYVRALKKDKRLLAWVMEVSKGLPAEAELAERVYVALYGIEAAICVYGQHKVFNALNKGFRFCASGCRCRREEQSRKIIKQHAELSDAERQLRGDRQKATLMKRHGVTNAMQIPSAVAKLKQTNRVRHGGNSPMASQAVRDRITKTNIERYGTATPQSLPEVRGRVMETNLERYGRTDTMHLARAAFTEQHGVCNPFLLPQYQAAARQTMFERYGVEKALQNPDILAKMMADVEKKWGVTNVALAPAVRQQIEATVMERYHRRFVNQDHIPDDGYAVLQDPEQFRAMFETMSLREVAMALGLSYDGARKYCERYGVDLPKSSYETAIAAFLRAAGFAVAVNDRAIIKPLELDIVLPEQKLAIEFCGLYWHSDQHKPDRLYHLHKMEAAAKAGLRLVTIFEDEWVFSREIVEARLLHMLGHGEKGIGARKASVRRISGGDAKRFLNLFHSQGGGPSGFANYGAFEGDRLISVMTFSRGRVAVGGKGGPVELLRFTTDGRNHPGVASKLFHAFVQEMSPPEVISYADRRWSRGELYIALGFEPVGASPPNYWYIHPNKFGRQHRFKYRKDQIRNKVADGENKSESEIMRELGFYRIWDCGTLKFRWKPA